MSFSPKRSLFILGGAAGLLVLGVLAVRLFVDINRYKARLEAAASAALGMDVRFDGPLRVAFLPAFRVRLEDGRILDAGGFPVASAKTTRLSIDAIRLLRGEFRLTRLELTHPRFTIRRDASGQLNFEQLKWVSGLLQVLNGATVAVVDATLLFADARPKGGFEATHLDLAVERLRLVGERGTPLLHGLALRAQLDCGLIRAKDFTVSALKLSVDGSGGVFDFRPMTMRVFGGLASCSLRADVSGPEPRYRLRCSLPQFRIEEFLKTVSPTQTAEGVMDFSTTLSMQGGTVRELVHGMAGAMSLRGENLVLHGNDLDRGLSRYDSSRNLNLVDVGGVFFAGPLGLVVTRGFTFASFLQGSGGSSRIRTLVSEWRIERGVAQAQDVALATPKNRIALQGGLDFVDGRFVNVHVAVIDAKGCARIRQEVSGTFADPKVDRPHVLSSLASPVLGILGRARKLLPSGPCEMVYSGSVAPPN